MDVPHWATTTMELLRLDKKYRATILQTQINTLGMLDKVKHYVSWQEADLEITKELLDKRGRKSGYRKIESEDLKEMGCLHWISPILRPIVAARTRMAEMQRWQKHTVSRNSCRGKDVQHDQAWMLPDGNC